MTDNTAQNRRRFRLGHHLRRNLVAYLALFIAVGMTPMPSWAAGQITSKQIKNNTIKSKDVKDNNLKGVDIRDGSLTKADLAAGTLSSAYSTFHDAAVSIQNQVSGQDPTVLSLSVPAGNYVFTATTWLDNANVDLLARCTLSAGADNDVKRQFLEDSAGAYASSVTLQVVHTFASAGTATFTCYGFGVAATAKNSKLTGIRVNALSNVAG